MFGFNKVIVEVMLVKVSVSKKRIEIRMFIVFIWLKIIGKEVKINFVFCEIFVLYLNIKVKIISFVIREIKIFDKII